MGTLRKLSFSRGATVNLGNFNNVRFEVSAEIELQEGDEENAAFQRLRDWVTQKIKAEIRGASNE